MASLVVGLGKTGASCLRYLAKHGIPATATDSRSSPPGLAEIGHLARTLDIRLGEFDLSLLEDASQVLMSPGVSLEEPIAREARARGIEVLGDVELFARAVRAPVIGVTGTNGKSTVTSLVASMASAAGHRVLAGGNLGVPVLDLLDQPIPDLYVLELSSFQLETTWSLDLEAAVVLNVTADHMDRYASIDAYARAKARIFARAATVVLNADDPLVAAMARPGSGIVGHGVGDDAGADAIRGAGTDVAIRRTGADASSGAAVTPVAVGSAGADVSAIGTGTDVAIRRTSADALSGATGARRARVVTFSTQRADTDYSLLRRGDRTLLARHGEALLDTARMKLTGLHNAANALAALALGEAAGFPLATLLDVLEAFPGLAHRSAWVADIGGVRYIDDSKGTNVGATLAAVAGMSGPLVMIAGGEGKGQDFMPLAAAFRSKVRHVVLIGKDAPVLERVLGAVCPISIANSMEDAVDAAVRVAQPGDTVLLSPACASLDMFRDYGHRGDVFAAAVRALAEPSFTEPGS